MRALFWLSLILSIPASAQTPYLVKDINTTTNSSPRSSSPYGFFRFGSRIFFGAAGADGLQLWSTDGTAAGTAQLLEINPHGSAAPSHFIELNGKLIFNADDGTHGEELWVSDGTAAGTHLLADIYPGSSSGSPGDRIFYHGKMIFAVYANLYGSALWITDGSPGGTQFLKDLGIPRNNSLPGPHSFVLLNDTVYFAAYGSLWKTDGTADGTVLVSSTFSDNLVVAGPRIFFTGSSQQGLEPWVSDGTAAGTFSLVSAAQAGYPHDFTAFGGGVLFDAADKLWFSDGTTAGTRLVHDYPGQALTIAGIAAAGDIAYVAVGPELWRTDSTAAGTTLVKVVGNYVSDLVVAGNKVYFVGGGTGIARTLWVSDGTPAGTQPVKSAGLTIHPASGFRPASSYPVLTNIDGRLWFSGANALNGDELWTSDGTDAGTSMLLNIAADGAPSSFPIGLTAARDLLFFNAWDGISSPTGSFDNVPRALWRSDGTAAGTMKLSDQIANNGYTAIDRSIVFQTIFQDMDQTWSSDGTPEGTGPAIALASRFPGAPSEYAVFGDWLFAFAGSDVFMTTMAPGGTVEKLPVPSPLWLTDVAGHTMFFERGVQQANLFFTDGTAAGTTIVSTSLPDIPLTAPTVAGGYLFFQIGTTLWKSDGTTEGTAIVKSGVAGNGFVAAGRKLFFTSSGQLWVSDGTDSGTHSLPVTPRGTLAAIGESVVFDASDSTNGDEPWVSDGTPAGTHLLLDLMPGPNGSFPNAITSAAGAVYFSALQGLWTTDGTTAGTKLVANVVSSINLTQLVQAGDLLYFTPTTAETGQELWALPLPTARLRINDTRLAEGDAGTTNAHFTVTLSSAASKPVTVDYATSDGSARAGSDYDAVSGTLTFTAGETSKTIDVPVHGNTILQNNRIFYVTLRNAAGAVIEKPMGFAIIDDDDQSADLALALDFSHFSGFGNVSVKATNNGPSPVTNLTTLFTVTPANSTTTTSCNCTPVQQLLPGAATTVFNVSGLGPQQYATVTATARQRDPQPSNNSVGWTANGYVAMDALYVAAGGQANVWFYSAQAASSVSIASSDPSVVSVPSSAPNVLGKPGSFAVTGVAAGTATVRVFVPGSSSDLGTLTVIVVATGAKPRWPGGVNLFANATTFDMPSILTVETFAGAPFTGEHATGLVTVTEGGRELGRVTLTGAAQRSTIPFYLADVGAHTVTVNYAGDANFLPVTTTSTITVSLGLVTISASPQRSGTTATVHVTVTGSPAAVPTGSVSIVDFGTVLQQAPLTAAGGAAVADFTVTNLSPGPHTLAITYSGDAHYRSAVQNVRIPEPRRRAAGH